MGESTTDSEFDCFRDACLNSDCWHMIVQEPDLQVFFQPSNQSSINIFKVIALFPDVDAWTLYDVLQDSEYRKVWDEYMLDSFCIEHLNENNDIGYYAVKLPAPLTDRDFVNQRSWRVRGDSEFIIMNRSVNHPAVPERNGFVRAHSVVTGYLIQTYGSGCVISYLSQSDPKGLIPSSLVNKATKTIAPKIVKQVHNAARGYNQWKSTCSVNPIDKPWRTANY